MRSKSAEKIKLTSYEDLFGETEQDNGEKVVYISLDKLHSFKNHPFHVNDDTKMQETIASVEQYGVLVPGIVRPSKMVHMRLFPDIDAVERANWQVWITCLS